MDPLTIAVIAGAAGGVIAGIIRKLLGRARQPSRGPAVSAGKVGLEDHIGPAGSAAKVGLQEFFEKGLAVSYADATSDAKPPTEPGLYAWYFPYAALRVNAWGCIRHAGRALVYIGQASDLRRRICNDHFRGNAEGSTLRRTLGCLLQDRLKIQLTTTRTGKWMFGSDGENVLSEWMQSHARVMWVSLRDERVDWPRKADETDKQVLDRAERRMIASFRLPLNLDDNDLKVCGEVKRIRDWCQEAAKKGTTDPAGHQGGEE